MKLTKISMAVSGALVLLALTFTLAQYLFGAALEDRTRTENETVLLELDRSRDLTVAALNIKIDVIQVQQWLQDISSTRGLDGLADGFEQAQVYADRLPNDLAEARTLAEALGEPDLVARLDAVEAAFPAFYATGREMAEAYIAGGPAQGNPMMAGFDAAAAAMGTAMDGVVEEIDTIAAQLRESAAADLDAIIADQRLHTWMTIGGQAILLLMLVLALRFFTDKFRKLNRTSEIAKEIAGGNLEAPRLAASKWEELAAMDQAIEVFRTNGEKLRTYQAEIDAKLETAADHLGQIAAISKSQAVVVFDLEGHLLDANDNFLSAMGYSLSEIKGRHHSTFVEPVHAASPEYKALWEKLRRGEYDAAEYKRIAKGGREVWLQAAYNPILDLSGKPVKVIKYATDITKRKTVIDAVQKNLSFLAEGDLSARIGAEIGGDYVALRDAFNDTMDRLQTMVRDIQDLSNSMSKESDTIAASAVELSKRTDGQAAAVQETSAAMEEIASTIRQNAENAGNAETVAGEAARRAGAGGGVVTEAISAMERIETSSSKISDIISVIDSIAFQTNLLALNAAVEAARAGDAGKGFAVVASEVRNLAQRSSNAAKDISDLISSSSRHIADGAQLVRQSGEAFGEINRKIDAVVRSVSEISVASREQAAGVTDISTAISQIDNTTQDNARLSEQSSENARALVEKTNGLRQLVSFFRAGAAEKTLDADWARTEHRSRKKVAVGARALPALAAQDDWKDF